MSEMVFNPDSGTQIGIIERHHVDSIMAAMDMGVEAPDEEDRTLRIMDSYASNPSNDIGQLDKAYGFKVITQVAKSLPFESSLLSKLLFDNNNDELKEKMVDSITEENKRQLSGRSISPERNLAHNLDLEQALGGEDGLTPPDAELKTKWSGLRNR